jgi:rod shape-determining protein MreB
MTGMPRTVVLTPQEIRRAIEEPLATIIESVVTCLSQAPPELAQDLLVQGIHLVGGGSLLRGLDLRLAEETGVPVHHVDAPMECVVLGAGQCIESFEAMRVMFMESRS